MNKQKRIQALFRLKENNQKVIDAIDSGKNINIPKAVKASMISNNLLTEILIDFFYNEKENINSSADSLRTFKDIFGI